MAAWRGQTMTTANAVPQLTILVPTRNEAENVEPLLKRLSATVEPGTVVLFVDDSDDDTPTRSKRRGNVDLVRWRGCCTDPVRSEPAGSAERCLLVWNEPTRNGYASWTGTSSIRRRLSNDY